MNKVREENQGDYKQGNGQQNACPFARRPECEPKSCNDARNADDEENQMSGNLHWSLTLLPVGKIIFVANRPANCYLNKQGIRKSIHRRVAENAEVRREKQHITSRALLCKTPFSLRFCGESLIIVSSS